MPFCVVGTGGQVTGLSLPKELGGTRRERRSHGICSPSSAASRGPSSLQEQLVFLSRGTDGAKSLGLGGDCLGVDLPGVDGADPQAAHAADARLGVGSEAVRVDRLRGALPRAEAAADACVCGLGDEAAAASLLVRTIAGNGRRVRRLLGDAPGEAPELRGIRGIIKVTYFNLEEA